MSCPHDATRRRGLQAALLAALSVPAVLRAEPAPIQRLGVFTLLGNSVRVAASELQEVMFKDVGMDDIALDAARAVLQAQRPQAQLSPHRAAEQVNIDDQLAIGTAAGRRGELPDWILQAAGAAALSHVLLITSNSGAMEFRTGMSQVVGNNRVTGIGFYVGADGRTKHTGTGAVASGYLAPFVQLRLTLIDVAGRSVVNSVSVSDGYIVGPREKEAPDPWRFLSRAEKAAALQQLLKTNISRGVEEVLKAR